MFANVKSGRRSDGRESICLNYNELVYIRRVVYGIEEIAAGLKRGYIHISNYPTIVYYNPQSLSTWQVDKPKEAGR